MNWYEIAAAKAALLETMYPQISKIPNETSMPSNFNRHDDGSVASFFKSLARGILRDLFFLLATFAVATGATAVVCWIYEIPLAVSLLGGLLVLALALAIKSDSIID